MNAASRPVKLALGAALILVQPSADAAWTLPEGQSLMIARFEEYWTDRSFDLDGDTHALPSNGEYRKSSIAAYLEYGLRDRWTMFANLPLEYARYDDSGFHSSGTSLGDGEIGIRHRLSAADARYAVSWQASVKVPLYSDSQDPAPGNHQVDLDLRLPVGYGFGDENRGAYIVAFPGVRWRAGEPTNEARLDLAIGWRPAAQWLFELSTFSIWSLQQGADTPPPTTSPGNGIDFDRTRIQLQAVYWLRSGFGVMVGGYSDVHGRNVGRGEAAFTGVWMRF